MSKKSRKKSSKSASGGPAAKARAKSKTAKTRTQSKAKPATKQRAPVRKSLKKTTEATSHKAASKELKSSKSAPAPAKAAKVTKAAGLAEGQMAPAFNLPRDGGGVAKLSDYTGKKLVLFFYPRADTPGCTREAIDFTRLANAFADANTAVLGMSADPPKAQERFRDKHKLAVPLISDEAHEMLEAYGAWGEKSMYGKTFLGIIRTTVLVGENGKVARVWRHVKVDGHADEVLAAARAL